MSEGEAVTLKRTRGGKKVRAKKEAHERRQVTTTTMTTTTTTEAAAADAGASADAPVTTGGKKARRAARPKEAAVPVSLPSSSSVDRSAIDGSKPPCAHFARALCTRGDNCRFSHATLEGAPATRGREGAQARHKKRDWDLTHKWQDPAATAKTQDEDLPAAPNCRGHDEPCVVRVVDKEGKNHKRRYWSCAHWKDKTKNCTHFKWVDAPAAS